MQEKEYTWCFACGKDNPIGLKMEFTMDAEECVAYFTPRQEHQSYDGRMHGGLISVLLDEIMGRLPVRHRRKTCLYGKNGTALPAARYDW